MSARHIVMGLAVVIAAWLALFGDKTPSSGIAEPVTRKEKTGSVQPNTATAANTGASSNAGNNSGGSAGSNGANNSSNKKSGAEPLISTLITRDVLIGSGNAEKRTDTLFSSQNWIAPAPPPPPVRRIALTPPPPVAPPLPFNFLGKKFEDGKWEIYLAHDEQTFIVREQTVIEATYRVDAIKPPILTMTYLPLNQIQTLTIGGTD